MYCKDGMHENLVKDKFSGIPGIKRHVPGDCFCLDCKHPIAALWNNGRPEPIDDAGEMR